MTSNLRFSVAAVAVILALATAPVCADQIVYFANGKAIQVKSVESQDKFTILEMEGGGKIGVPTEQIARIEVVTPASPAPAAVPATVVQAPVVAAPVVAAPAVASPAAAQTAQVAGPPPAAVPPQPGISPPGAAGRRGAMQGDPNRRFSPPRSGGPMLSVGAGPGGRPGMGRPGAGRTGARQGTAGPRGGKVAPPSDGSVVVLPDPDEDRAPEESTAQETTPPSSEDSSGDEASTEPAQEEDEAPPPDDAPPSGA